MMESMFSLMKKGMLFNVGLMAYTIDKTQEIINDMVKKGDEAVTKFQDEAEKIKAVDAELDEKIKKQVKEVLSHMDIPTKKDIQELHKKLDQIVKKV